MQNPLENFSFGDPFNTWWPFVFAVAVGIITTIRTYFAGPTCTSTVNITNQRIVVTGGSRGIGLEVALNLASRGAHVIIACRNEKAAKENFEKLRKTRKLSESLSIHTEYMDLLSFDSIRQFSNKVGEGPIDVLINGASVVYQPFQVSSNGYEQHLAVNYLGHFLLTQLLLPKLKMSTQGRVVNVSASAHYSGTIHFEDINLGALFEQNRAYAQSKLALVMMSTHLSKLLKGTDVTINSVQPGLVRGTSHLSDSPIENSWFITTSTIPWKWLFMKTPEQGAQTIIWAAIAPELCQTTGKYFSDCALKEPSQTSQKEDLCARLYKNSLEWVGLQKDALTTAKI